MQLVSQRDQPGTQREYETIYVLTPEADADQIQTINTRIRRIIDDGQGKLMRVENWGKRKLAYEIRKQTRGIYLYWRYLSPPPLIAEIERNLRMLDPVLRYITVKIDENVNPEARPSDVDDERFAQAAHTIPDEEDIAMGRSDRDGEPDDDDDFLSDGDHERRPRLRAAADEDAKHDEDDTATAAPAVDDAAAEDKEGE